MWNARLDESQAWIKIAGGNINDFRYAIDTTLIGESEEVLKSLLMRVKKKIEKVGLKVNMQETKIMASNPITSWQTDGEKVETVTSFLFLGSKITADGDSSHEIKKILAPWKESYDNPRKWKLLSCVWLFCDPMDYTVLEFSRQEYWSV